MPTPPAAFDAAKARAARREAKVARRGRDEPTLDRIATYFLLFVILVTGAFAIGSSQSTSRSASLAIQASELSDHYDAAAQAIGAEESLERKYRLEPGPEVRRRFSSAADSVTAAMDRVRRDGSAGDGRIADTVLSAHVAYLDSAGRMFDAVDRGDMAEVQRIDGAEADPRFDAMEKAVVGASDAGHLQSIGALEDLRAREAFGVWSTPIAFLVALGLVAGFSALLRKTRAERRQAQATLLESEERTIQLGISQEAAEAASRAKSDFLATMSHEIRTPMNGVIGMVEVLAHSPLNEAQADAVRTIRASGFSLLRIIDDILDFSKIEAGRLDLESAPVALSDLIEGVSDTLLPVAQNKNVDLSLFIHPRVPQQVWADATRLRQVLYNLIGNAIKFSAGRSGRRGQVSIRVDVEQAATPKLVLRIADNGIGMTPETVARLFVAFNQAEVSTTRRFGGTGLGLAICRRLVSMMGGEIAVESALEAGSTFTVTVPLEAVPEDATSAYADVAGQDCILVGVDRDVEDQRVYLEHAGARVHHVADLQLAMQRAAGLGAAVVILNSRRDVSSPDAMDTAFRTSPNVRHLLITRGQRRGERESARALVTLEGDCLRRSALLDAVATAAGRASPRVERAVGGEAFSSRVPLTVVEAREQGRLVLIAEDDETNLKVILRQMALLGYVAESARDGAEALRMWRSGNYGLLLSDLNMPEMDGYTLVETIRHEEATKGRSLRRMPVLALTANALRSEALKAEAAGMDEYLTKPLQLAQLAAALLRWLPHVGDETVPVDKDIDKAVVSAT